ncbi:isoamylase early set domain-containing protein [Flavilitoribacter nigricans]|uniref:isoamylase early set domain-containing protein n=1 Tax=Flavilitoribacter nigricans TaxID=70997 RepID=UPI001473E9F5|nr:isoamylase early set domain-containing protein [Flavilitoribacter nigricans]
MLKKQYSKNKPVCKVTFTLPKEAVDGAKEVKVLGEFNNWSWKEGLPMKSGKDGYKATVELATGRHYEFRYLLDNETWVNDWEADAYYPTPYGVENSVIFIESVEIAAPKAKKSAKKVASAKPAAKKAKITKAAPKKVKAAPVKKTAPVADDLKKIEGIGPKIAGLLNAKGIHTYADLSKAKKAILQETLAAAGSRYKMHDPTTWPQQAKLAAKGDWAKLDKLQAELKGGKKK